MKVTSNEDVAVGDMHGDLLERKPLPIGVAQFEEWSDRIIKASAVEASPRSLKNALATMLLHLGPTEAFKPDAYYALALRVGAIKQTAQFMFEKIQNEKKAELAAQKLAEETAANIQAADGLLEKQEV